MDSIVAPASGAVNPEVAAILAQAEMVERYPAERKATKKLLDSRMYQNKKAKVASQGLVPVAAPVPHAICAALWDALAIDLDLDAMAYVDRTGVDLGADGKYVYTHRIQLFEYGFRFLAHLLARSGGMPGNPVVTVPQGTRWALAKTPSGSLTARWTQLLRDRGVIHLAKPAKYDDFNLSFSADGYSIPDTLLAALAASSDPRFYGTPAEFLNKRPLKTKPHKTLHDSVTGEPSVDKALRDAIARLQFRPLRCDVLALRAHYRGLGEEAQRKYRHVVTGMRTENVTLYKLAQSGRLQTCRDNLQGIPKTLRQFFFPDDPDRVFLDLDFKCQESFIIAALSGDTALLRELEHGDIYKTAADLFGLDRNKHGKRLINAANYGGHFKAIGEILFDDYHIGNATEEQQAAIMAYFQFLKSRYPTAHAWLRNAASGIRRTGVAAVPGGLTRSGIPAKLARRQGVNHLVQGTAALIMWEILRHIDDDLGDLGHVVLPIHDGILLSVDRDKRDQAHAIAVETMQRACKKVIGREIPVTHNWGWCLHKHQRYDDAAGCNLRP